METKTFPWKVQISANLHYLKEYVLLKKFYQLKAQRESCFSGFLTDLVIDTQKYYYYMVMEKQEKDRESQEKEDQHKSPQKQVESPEAL